MAVPYWEMMEMLFGIMRISVFQQSADKENIVCNHCKHFPICCGPYPVQRNNMIRTTGKVSCMFSLEEKEEKMEREVTKYYREITNHQQTKIR